MRKKSCMRMFKVIVHDNFSLISHSLLVNAVTNVVHWLQLPATASVVICNRWYSRYVAKLRYFIWASIKFWKGEMK